MKGERIFRREVTEILTNWDELERIDPGETCPVVGWYRRHNNKVRATRYALFNQAFCEMCSHIFPELARDNCPCSLFEKAIVQDRVRKYLENPV